MSDQIEGGVSILEILTRLIERWKAIAICAVLGGGVAALSVISRPPLFRAYASFSAQQSDQGRSAFAGLAGQFGLAIPGSGQVTSPEYYAKLVKSRTLLLAVARDSFNVPEMGRTNTSLSQLFALSSTDSSLRTEQALAILDGIVRTSISKQTGIIEVSATTRWRSVSLAIVEAVVLSVNRFNQESRRVQAMAEREFVEGRLSLAAQELRGAEDRMQELQRGNRQFDPTSDVSLQRSRLMADLDRRRQVVTSLAQAYEEVRLREVRDTPSIIIVENPAVPAVPEPRGRLKVGFMGLAVGTFAGYLFILAGDSIRRRRAAGDPRMLEFLATLSTQYADVTSPVRRLFRRHS